MRKTKCFGILACVAVMAVGLPSSIDAQQAPQAPNTTFFVAANMGKGADLGGINGADAHCQALATAVGAGNKVWRAYLSTNAGGGSINARDRIMVQQRERLDPVGGTQLVLVPVPAHLHLAG